jgi:hypothetical protein
MGGYAPKHRCDQPADGLISAWNTVDVLHYHPNWVVMVRNPSETLDSKPKNALFPPTTGWVSAGMALFSNEKMNPFCWIF